VDADARTDKVWLLGIQRKLYQWSRLNPEGQYRELWGWITDSRNLRCAWRTVASNKGRRTPGIDGVTVKHVQKLGEEAYLEKIREELRIGLYRPSPSRRAWIPKSGKPGEFRPLGILTVKDRIVQCAVKQIMEPLFEARFWHVSFGFRPGRSCHAAVELIRCAMHSGTRDKDGRRHAFPYVWVIEGDVKGCFDHISHRQVLEGIRRRCGDGKVNRLIRAFLKAGVLAEDQYIRTDAGTPQGGIISPLLSNIALSVIEERYGRWVNQAQSTGDGMVAARNTRVRDRKKGRPVFFPIRYADDFVILVSGSEKDALVEKEMLADYLKETAGLDLSENKTLITPTDRGFEFLGQRIRMKWDDRYGYYPRVEVPKEKVLELCHRIKLRTGPSTTTWSLDRLLGELNPTLRGWGHYYRFCTGAKRIFARIDWYVGDRIWRWLKRKYAKAGASDSVRSRELSRIYPGRAVWRGEKKEQFLMGHLTVERFKLEWMRRPDYAWTSGEPDT